MGPVNLSSLLRGNGNVNAPPSNAAGQPEPPVPDNGEPTAEQQNTSNIAQENLNTNRAHGGNLFHYLLTFYYQIGFIRNQISLFLLILFKLVLNSHLIII